MFIAPSAFWNPPFFYYFAITPNNTPPLQAPSLHKQQTTKPTSTKYEYESQTVEKLILTEEDLIQQGYQQTKKAWSEEEDKMLLSLCKNEDARFEEIASKIEGRNAKMCYSRYRRLNYQKRVGWSKLDNQKLLHLIEQHGDKDWKFLADFFQGKTHKQLKDHYKNYLNPSITKTEWTFEEDLQLIKLINLHAKDWKTIEQSLGGRSRNQIKNRYFGKLTRMNKKKLSRVQKGTKRQISLAY